MYIAAAFAAAITSWAAVTGGLNLRQKQRAKKALKTPSN